MKSFRFPNDLWQSALWLFLALTLARGLLCIVIIPPWQSPDETGHFEYVWLMTRLGRLPTPDDMAASFESEMLASLYEWRFGDYIGRSLPEQMPEYLEQLPNNIFAKHSRTLLSQRFSLSYVWASVFLYPFQHQDLIVQLYSVRFSSVVLAMLGCWLAFRTAQLLWPDQPAMVFTMLVMYTFIPQRTFINSMAGDGPLAELMSLLVFYSWLNLFKAGFTITTGVGIVAGTLVGIMSKNTAVFLVPFNLLSGLYWLIRIFGWSRSDFKRFWGVFVGLLILGLGVWLWISSTTLGKIAFQNFNHSLQVLDRNNLLFIDQTRVTFGQVLLLTYQSFWANLGWMAVPVSERWYGALLLLTIIGFGGWLVRSLVSSTDKGLAHLYWVSCVMCVSAIGVFVWIALLSKATHYQYQGRYLFTIAFPVIHLWLGGIKRYFHTPLPLLVNKGLVVFLIVFDTWCWAKYVIPFFYS